MKKRMIAGVMFLVLTVSGCSAVSTAPTTINELAEETRAEAETESPESTAAPETAASQPIAEENAKHPRACGGNPIKGQRAACGYRILGK